MKDNTFGENKRCTIENKENVSLKVENKGLFSSTKIVLSKSMESTM